jgi:hypothetical protein
MICPRTSNFKQLLQMEKNEGQQKRWLEGRRYRRTALLQKRLRIGVTSLDKSVDWQMVANNFIDIRKYLEAK